MISRSFRSDGYELVGLNAGSSSDEEKDERPVRKKKHRQTHFVEKAVVPGDTLQKLALLHSTTVLHEAVCAQRH